MLQLTHLKLNTCSPQKALAHDQTGLLQVLDFVRDRTRSRSPVQNWGGLLNAPLPSRTHHHTTYYTCGPHLSWSPHSQAASGPGPPLTPQPPYSQASLTFGRSAPAKPSEMLDYMALSLSPSTLHTRPRVLPSSRIATWTLLWRQLCVQSSDCSPPL